MDHKSDMTEYSSLDREALLRLLLIRDSEIANLRQKLAKTKAENKQIIEKASKLNVGIQVDSISQNNGDLLPVAVQVPETSSETDYEEKPMPIWIKADNAHPVSIADVLRETAEGEMRCQGNKEDESQQEETSNDVNSEYIFDSDSGYYYHPATGYYWDPNSRLFFDYTSGVYYQFNEETGSYEVHSSLSNHKNSSASPDSAPLVNLASKPRERIKRKELSHEKGSKLKRRLKKSRSKIICHRKEKPKSILFETITGKSDTTPFSSDHHDNVPMGKYERQNDVTKSDEVMDFENYESDSSDSLASGESELVSEVESGELISSDDCELLEGKDDDPACHISDKTDEYEFQEAMATEYPPCIRFIVQESESLPIGALYIVTCTGGSIGREKSLGHALMIPDTSVSKSHAEIFYDYDGCFYKIKDLGSCNGTMINGKRLSHSKEESASHPLSHDDNLQVGNVTKLLVHIHKGYETCEDCEPGQVQAKLKSLSNTKNDIQVLSKEEKKIQQKQELKRIKKKFGLQNSYFESPGATVKKSGYEDKALARRKLIGSENDNERMEVTSSVNSPINASNKGHKLLAKMGWKEGEGLGKTNTGMAEPINVEFRLNQSAGLGCNESTNLSLDNLQQAPKLKRWTQAKQRFNKLDNENYKLRVSSTQVIHSPSVQIKNVSADQEGSELHISQAYPEAAILTTSLQKDPSKHPSKMKWVKGDTQIIH